MARPSGPKVRCNGQWTEAKYTNFIKNQLRSGTRKWAPIHQCLKDARVGRGLYHCAGCDETVSGTMIDPDKNKRVKNIFVDHTNPIVDPAVGFVDWNTFIENTFCELDNLQALCKKCHDEKTKEEREVATLRRRKEKELD